MAEWVCRALRDGGLEGEHAPALTINDTITSPLGSFVFDHILSQLSSLIFFKKSPATTIVLVALSRSPLYYDQLLQNKGYDVASSNTWFKVLDCYTDPLGWKSKLMESAVTRDPSVGSPIASGLCRNVKDLDKLFSAIIELGAESSADGKGRFIVAFDSVSELLRHSSVSSVAAVLSKLRSHARVSSLFWLFHSDLHEKVTTSALEYMSSMKATIETNVLSVNSEHGNSPNLYLMEHNSRRGKFCVRAKRRNGRVKIMYEELFVEKSGVKFKPVSYEDGVTAQSLVPKVQFNLQLSEKERDERAKVVLPFEHQGNGKTIEIYDGRKSLIEDGKAPKAQNPSAEKSDSSKGEIIYFRDSDDEMPDSDEDPDDDLDI